MADDIHVTEDEPQEPLKFVEDSPTKRFSRVFSI